VAAGVGGAFMAARSGDAAWLSFLGETEHRSTKVNKSQTGQTQSNQETDNGERFVMKKRIQGYVRIVKRMS
jgi:hypothetical protein